MRLYSTETTFYKRELPSILTSLQSSNGKTFFQNAMKDGNAEPFFSLVGNFSTQSEPAFCGLSSLSMSLNALAIDPKRRWKGVWRYYCEEMLECTPENVKSDGMTFDQVHQVALCNGLDVLAKRGDQITFKEFIDDINNVTSSTDKLMIVSFSRKSLLQTGDGHFSPVGAISRADDQILVMDTARYFQMLM
jgi:glutathione gamma-glutamylcysteinyltransferase